MLFIKNLTLDDADIPDDKNVAFERNTMRLTRLNAVAQVKSMVNLVDEIAVTTLKSLVVGETIDTAAPLGCKMKMSK